MIQSIQDLNPIGTLVVTGFYADAIEEEIQSINQDARILIRFIRNSKPEAEQSSSVRLGLETLTSDHDVLFIALCDQPLVGGAAEIQSLLDQCEQSLGVRK